MQPGYQDWSNTTPLKSEGVGRGWGGVSYLTGVSDRERERKVFDVSQRLVDNRIQNTLKQHRVAERSVGIPECLAVAARPAWLFPPIAEFAWSSPAPPLRAHRRKGILLKKRGWTSDEGSRRRRVKPTPNKAPILPPCVRRPVALQTVDDPVQFSPVE
eukprot:1448847-Rhodomonas_salina.1